MNANFKSDKSLKAKIKDNKTSTMNLIQYMRERQAQDRGTLLLTNTNFVNYLLDLK